MACKSLSSSIGLVRNSMAPAFIACTDAGMLPWPVRNTMGISSPASAMRSCKSSPLSPGSFKSKIRQLGVPSARRPQNSWAEAKVSTLHPADRIRLCRPSRTDASSSTIAMIASDSLDFGMQLFSAVHRKGEVKPRTRGVLGRRPEPTAMALNDRPADRESHAHTARLRRVEGVEYLLHPVRIKARSGVLDGHLHLTVNPVSYTHLT